MKSTQQQASAVYKKFLVAFINSSNIDAYGMAPDELDRQFRQWATTLPDDFDVVVDHTPRLLALARQFHREEKLELAVLMYATWVEHMLNMILRYLAEMAHIDEKYVNSMIKESSSKAKATWLLGLLGARPLPSKALLRMQKLAEARNAFVHYKWGQLSKKEKEGQTIALTDVEHLVKTLQRVKRQDLKHVSQRSSLIQAVLSSAP